MLAWLYVPRVLDQTVRRRDAEKLRDEPAETSASRCSEMNYTLR